MSNNHVTVKITDEQLTLLKTALSRLESDLRDLVNFNSGKAANFYNKDLKKVLELRELLEE